MSNEEKAYIAGFLDGEGSEENIIASEKISSFKESSRSKNYYVD
jgi:hypothetical protein